MDVTSPLNLVFVCSKRLLALSIVLHALTIIAVLSAFSGILMWVLLGFVLVSARQSLARILLRNPNAVTGLLLNTTGQVSLRFYHDETWHPVTLCSGSFVSPLGMVLHWQGLGHKRWQIVMPDMVDGDAYRQLTVWARWCQPK